MLIEFSVENFRSIKEKVTLSMLASANKGLEDNIINAQINKTKSKKETLKLLNSIAIYGANAAGKSNLIDAFRYSIYCLAASQSFLPNQPFPPEQFKIDESCLNKPSSFEYKFIQNGVVFNYGMKVLGSKVVEEYLNYYPNGRIMKVFSRQNDKIDLHLLKNSNNSETENEIRLKIYKEEISDNILILSLANKIKIPQIMEAYSWFATNIHCLVDAIGIGAYTQARLADKTIDNELFKSLFKFADSNIKDFRLEQQIVPLEKVPNEVKQALYEQVKLNPNIQPIGAGKIDAFTFVDGKDEYGNNKEIRFRIEENSKGTLKYYGILGEIIYVLCNGGLLIIDELELRLHTNLTKIIVEFFSSPLNKKNAQLIFTTHNTNLLDIKRLLRRDQIYFVEKNNEGATDLYSLIDFKVRNDKVIQKAYLEGIFGAVPNFNLEELF